jgi:hypothetical protein
MANYKALIVFQKADELAIQIYRVTEKFPKSEMSKQYKTTPWHMLSFYAIMKQ